MANMISHCQQYAFPKVDLIGYAEVWTYQPEVSAAREQAKP